MCPIVCPSLNWMQQRFSYRIHAKRYPFPHIRLPFLETLSATTVCPIDFSRSHPSLPNLSFSPTIFPEYNRFIKFWKCPNSIIGSPFPFSFCETTSCRVIWALKILPLSLLPSVLTMSEMKSVSDWCVWFPRRNSHSYDGNRLHG